MRKDFTLLHADIVDSTAVNSRLGDAAMAPLWDAHDHASRELVRRHGGREVDRSDGFMLLFARTADAVAFAIDYHRMLQTLPVRLKARTGIHVGPLTLRENGAAEVALGAKPLEVVGIAKAYSARLMTLAQGGQTLMSPSARVALRAEAPATAVPWRIVSHGHWRLKGIDGVLEVFEVGDEQAAFVPPPDAEKSQRVVQVGGEWLSVREVPNSLPAERDSFVGRGEELKTLANHVHEGARLITVAGPGGMGKTRLALRYAWAFLADHPGGVWFCDLSSAHELDGLLHAAAQGLDVPLGNDPVGQLGRAIAGRGRCLVILDNFEQLRRHARDTLGRWLDMAPAARFLVTSREVLGLAGERTLLLEPLAPSDGVALFHQRAGAAHAAHDPGATDPDVARQLVELLDGLPLAIELAAPRVRVMRPHELLARMGDRFRLLAAGDGRPDRQATLRATLTWSWDLLTPAERAVLAQLAVFAGSFSWSAAGRVIGLDHEIDGGHGGAPWALDLLQSLVDKSLVRPLPGARFGLLRSVQEFAAEQLARQGSFPGSGAACALATRQRHLAYYAALDEEAAVAFNCIELENLIGACRHGIADGRAGPALACLQLAWEALRRTGPFRAAAQLAAEVLALAGLTPTQIAAARRVEGQAWLAAGDTAQAREVAERAMAALPPDAPPVLSSLLHALAGELHLVQGEFGPANQRFALALRHAEAAGDAGARCTALNSMGACAQHQGHLKQAQRHYEEALAVAFAADHTRWQAGLLGNLAGLHYSEGRLDAARKAYEQSLALARQINNRRQEGNARCNLGLIHHEQGRPAEAEAELQLALSAANTLGYPRLANTVRCNLGLVQQARGDLDGALRHFIAAVEGAQTSGDKLAEAEFRSYLDAARTAAASINPC